MKISVLGTGIVGQTIGSKLIQSGHEVMMGSRTLDNAKGTEWVTKNGENASLGTFANSAAFGEIIFNCTSGMGTLEALKMAEIENMRGKILIDISNPLDFSKGMPPTLSVCNTDSLAEQIQNTFPEVKVVKTLNTLNCALMVNPSSLADGNHDIFMSGNDADAKAKVKDILMNWFGWKGVIDLGNISTARGTEQILPLWIRLMVAQGNANFNFKIVK